MPTSSTARTLLLLRHAKAEPASGSGDLGRVLSARGTADAKAVGAWLARSGVHVDLVVCSPSARTWGTWQTAVAGGASAGQVEQDRRLYDASDDELLTVLRESPGTVRAVVLVGHAPGVPTLAAVLADPGRSRDRALADVRRRFPTSGLARFEYDGEWSALDAASASLVEFVVPRG